MKISYPHEVIYFFFTIFPTKTKLTVLLFFNDYFLQTVEYVCACIILTVKNN